MSVSGAHQYTLPALTGPLGLLPPNYPCYDGTKTLAFMTVTKAIIKGCYWAIVIKGNMKTPKQITN